MDEHGPFTDDVPSYKPPFISWIFQFAMLNNQMVIHPNVDGYITSWQTPS
jgi:hypothetical protein